MASARLKGELRFVSYRWLGTGCKILQSSRAYPSPIRPPPRASALKQIPRPHFLLDAKGGGGNERETKAQARPLPSRQMAAGKCLGSVRVRPAALRIRALRVCLLPRIWSFLFSMKTIGEMWEREL